MNLGTVDSRLRHVRPALGAAIIRTLAKHGLRPNGTPMRVLRARVSIDSIHAAAEVHGTMLVDGVSVLSWGWQDEEGPTWAGTSWRIWTPTT